MLTALYIENVVLIDRLSLSFEDGFSALTGETGAGKSILLDALGLALGLRAETGLVRKGTDKTTVTATFAPPKAHPVYALLHDHDMEVEDGMELIFRRTLTPDGRSRAYIDDRPVSAGLLKQAGEHLVEVHGQFAAQGLTDPALHRDLLDEYAGLDTQPLSGLWAVWQDAEKNFEAAQNDANAAQMEQEALREFVSALETLGPEAGEEDHLTTLRERLMNRERIAEGLGIASAEIETAEIAITSAFRALDKAGETSAALQDALERASVELQEAITGVQSLSADLENEDHDLESVDERLFALRAQARRHNCQVKDLPALYEELQQKLALTEGRGDILSDLKKKVEEARTAYCTTAEETATKRHTAAKKLSAAVSGELPPLKLEKARFTVAVEPLPENEWGPHGTERIRFLVSTNPGTEPGPLHKIASGGEQSRLMLALRVVLADTGAAQTLIFDEADSGIGGSTAAAVGERLVQLSKTRQVMAVTHSPQVAARAAHHWIVMKGEGEEGITTTVIPLDGDNKRQEEIARMLSGVRITEEARAAAEQLLKTG